MRRPSPAGHPETLYRGAIHDGLSGSTLGSESITSSVAYHPTPVSEDPSREIWGSLDFSSWIANGRPVVFSAGTRTESPEPMRSVKVARANAGSPKKKDARNFVMESGNGATSDRENSRPRRQGGLDPKTRTTASKVRSIGACWRCKIMKHQVSRLFKCLSEFVEAEKPSVRYL